MADYTTYVAPASTSPRSPKERLMVPEFTSFRFFSHNLDDSPGAAVPKTELQIQLGKACADVIEEIELGLQQGEGLRGPQVYVGLAGIALMYLRLAEVLQRLQGHKSQLKGVWQQWTPEDMLSKALDCIQVAEDKCSVLRHHKRVTFLEGSSGCMAVKAAILSRMGRQQEALQAQEAVEALGQDVLQLPPEDCELLYGRCGYIYALLIARQYTGNNSAATQQLIKTLLQQVVQEGQKNAKQVGGTFSLLYQWHGTIYLGAAHGLAGITMTLCQAFPELLELYPTDALNLVTDEIAGLVQVTFPSGNLPSSLGKDKDKLIQWCHGAPGFVPLLAEAHRLLGKYQGQAAASSDFYGPQMQADVVKAGEAAGDQIWHRGLLKKGLGLCHGISGNTYALLSLYRLSGHAVWLRRAEQFALFAADKWQDLLSLPDAPLSLYEGAAGMVSLWADLLDPDSARFPGYEL